MSLNMDIVERGPGVWILNYNFLFDDEYKMRIDDLISREVECTIIQNFIISTV